MQIKFFKMTEEDLDKVVEIENDNFSTPWSRQGFREALDKDYCCFITAKDENGEVAGYCGLYQSDTEADITNVAVDKKFRRQHIAEEMLKELMKTGSERGIKSYTLEVRCSNEGAITLYTKLGFESAGIRKNFYRNPIEDANIMWRY